MKTLKESVVVGARPYRAIHKAVLPSTRRLSKPKSWPRSNCSGRSSTAATAVSRSPGSNMEAGQAAWRYAWPEGDDQAQKGH